MKLADNDNKYMEFTFDLMSEENAEIKSYISNKSSNNYCGTSDKLSEIPTIKRFKSSYILFSIDKREELKKLFPFKLNQDLTIMIGEAWKNATNEEKDIYKNKEKQEREKFDQMKKSENLKLSYKKEKIKKPVRFRTAYMLFIQDNKDLLKNEINLNIEKIKRLSNHWKKMLDSEKHIYLEKSRIDKLRYEKEWVAYIDQYFKIMWNKGYQTKKKMKRFLKSLKSKNVDKKMLEELELKIKEREFKKKYKKRPIFQVIKVKRHDEDISDKSLFSKNYLKDLKTSKREDLTIIYEYEREMNEIINKEEKRIINSVDDEAISIDENHYNYDYSSYNKSQKSNLSNDEINRRNQLFFKLYP